MHLNINGNIWRNAQLIGEKNRGLPGCCALRQHTELRLMRNRKLRRIIDNNCVVQRNGNHE